MKFSILFVLLVIRSFAAEFEMNVLVGGKPTDVFQHCDRQFIEGKKDVPFTVQLKNNSSGRVIFIPNVDGVNVIDGTTVADSGYIVQPNSSYEIMGWRTSDKEVRKFVFSAKGEGRTYVEKLGLETKNCGVIGVRVYREKQTMTYIGPVIEWKMLDLSYSLAVPGTYTIHPITNFNSIDSWSLLNTTTTFDHLSHDHLDINSSLTSASSFDLGTAMGTALSSPVHETPFNRDVQACDISIYYATASGLASLGVDIYPKAFAGLKFCKPVE